MNPGELSLEVQKLSAVLCHKDCLKKCQPMNSYNLDSISLAATLKYSMMTRDGIVKINQTAPSLVFLSSEKMVIHNFTEIPFHQKPSSDSLKPISQNWIHQ